MCVESVNVILATAAAAAERRMLAIWRLRVSGWTFDQDLMCLHSTANGSGRRSTIMGHTHARIKRIK